MAGPIPLARHSFCEGQDPRDVELMWDQMWRSTINYGRKGLPIQCISAVDLAIWDLLGARLARSAAVPRRAAHGV